MKRRLALAALAMALDTPTATATSTATSEPTAESTATVAPTEPPVVDAASVDSDDADRNPAAANVVSPEASVVAETIALDDPSSPRDVVETFGARWAAGDYSGLYELLTADAKASITRQDFVDRYEAIRAEAGLTAVKLTVTGDTTLDAGDVVTSTNL